MLVVSLGLVAAIIVITTSFLGFDLPETMSLLDKFNITGFWHQTSLAKKHRLPADVQAFITEHHGTTRVQYFYRQACELSDKPEAVDETAFRYPGPKPQRRETGILMLADSCESAARAKKPSTAEAFDELVREIINDKIGDDQLSECDLTTHDLDEIRRAFVEIFQGTLHHRIDYPLEQKKDQK